jgi:hypothetical protein
VNDPTQPSLITYRHCGDYKFTIHLELFGALEKEHGMQIRDSIESDVREAAYHLTELIDAEIDSYNPRFIAWREEWLSRAPVAFMEAGLGPIYIEQIPDEYSRRKWMPWLMVTTPRGHFKVGWRKRVIELDWSKTNIHTCGTSSLFEKEDVTKDERYIHAWSYAKLVEYLRILKDAP